MRIIPVLIAAAFALILVGCQEDYGDYVDGSVHGEERSNYPVYTEGTEDDVFKRIQESAGG